MTRTRLALAALLGFATATATALSGCSGGCYSQAGSVTTTPDTACLTLFAGTSATDGTVCGAPDLSGKNDCALALTLPPLSPGGAPVVVAAGARLFHPLVNTSGVAGVTVTTHGDTTDYTLDATLGATPLVITFSVHAD